jgi:hypothetical protein
VKSGNVKIFRPRPRRARFHLRPELVAYVEQVADELLKRSKLPLGSAPSDVARALGHAIQWDPTIGSSAHLDPLNQSIILAPTPWRCRAELSIGHELMHAYGPKLHRAGVSHEECEAACDRGAAALLMPRAEFMASGEACDWNVEQLRQRWFHASRTALVRRIAELRPAARRAA